MLKFFFLGIKNEANLYQLAKSHLLKKKDEKGKLIEKGIISKQRYVLKKTQVLTVLRIIF